MYAAFPKQGLKVRHSWLTLVLVAALAGCGGGGGGGGGGDGGSGSNTGGNGSGTTGSSALRSVSLGAGQSSASQAVGAANSTVAHVLEAENAGNLPGGAQLLTLPGGATYSGTLQCSTLGTSGSGNVTYSIDSTDGANARPVGMVYRYNDCRYTAGGTSLRMNGTMSMTYDRWTDSSNYAFTTTYDITYDYSGSGYSDSDTYRGSETCTVTANSFDCAYNVGGDAVRDASVSSSGSVVTVSATVSSGGVTAVFSNWRYDQSTGRATSGTVTITDGNGNRAVITASASGYSVVITWGGSSQTYTVAFS